MGDDFFKKKEAAFEKATAELAAEKGAALPKEEKPMMKEIDISYRTMFAELVQRSLDAQFHADFPLRVGS